MIEDAYALGGAAGGLPVWCCDEAGPFQTVPHPGASWRPEGRPATQPHEYTRNGTAKVLTLFHPASGRVEVEGATSTTNAVLHAWLERGLTGILAGLPTPDPVPLGESCRACWERWQDGLTWPITLPQNPPRLRMLLVLDNLAGHKTPAFVCWLFAHGVMPVYTPLGGSWLNMAESIQRVLKRRALDGQHPSTPGEVAGWFEAAARHWNADPTPFAWGGKRAARRARARARRHGVGGSGAETRRPVRRRRRSYGQDRDK